MLVKKPSKIKNRKLISANRWFLLDGVPTRSRYQLFVF